MSSYSAARFISLPGKTLAMFMTAFLFLGLTPFIPNGNPRWFVILVAFWLVSWASFALPRGIDPPEGLYDLWQPAVVSYIGVLLSRLIPAIWGDTSVFTWPLFVLGILMLVLPIGLSMFRALK